MFGKWIFIFSSHWEGNIFKGCTKTWFKALILWNIWSRSRKSPQLIRIIQNIAIIISAETISSLFLPIKSKIIISFIFAWEGHSFSIFKSKFIPKSKWSCSFIDGSSLCFVEWWLTSIYWRYLLWSTSRFKSLCFWKAIELLWSWSIDRGFKCALKMH